MRHPDGRNPSPWYEGVTFDVGVPLPSPPPRLDVCVVGGGIAGITTAYLLAREGKRVAVLDEGAIGSGQTGRTSAHLVSAIDDRFAQIERMHGTVGSRLAYESHAAAIDLIEGIARDESIDCDFARIPAYLVAPDEDAADELEREAAAANRAGLAARVVTDAPRGLLGHRAFLRFEHQARFHPLRYLVGLARAATRNGATIHTGARVVEVHGRTGDLPPRAVLAPTGEHVCADAIVVATNVPGIVRTWDGAYLVQAAYRSYVIALALERGAVEDVLLWDTLDPYHYARVVPRAEGDLLIVGGEDHKTGQLADDADPFAALERWARASFAGCRDVVWRWSGQVQEPTDGLGFIGRAPTVGDGVFVITGDSGMGLTHGTLGAKLVTDLALGRANPWTELYDPERKPVHSLATFVRENLDGAAQYRDLVTPGDAEHADEIGNDTGAIVREGLAKIAVYRDCNGRVHRCDAICPHLGAVVRWNPIERTWDCPAHGSRFAATGELLVGPAVTDLEPS